MIKTLDIIRPPKGFEPANAYQKLFSNINNLYQILILHGCEILHCYMLIAEFKFTYNKAVLRQNCCDKMKRDVSVGSRKFHPRQHTKHFIRPFRKA